MTGIFIAVSVIIVIRFSLTVYGIYFYLRFLFIAHQRLQTGSQNLVYFQFNYFNQGKIFEHFFRMFDFGYSSVFKLECHCQTVKGQEGKKEYSCIPRTFNIDGILNKTMVH